MYIKKQDALLKANKWVNDLTYYRDKFEANEANWGSIGRTARETLGKVGALWAIDLITDEEWETLYEKIWKILIETAARTNIIY